MLYSLLGSASEDVEGLGDSGLGFFSWASWMGTAIWLRSMVCCRGLDSPFSFTAQREKPVNLGSVRNSADLSDFLSSH